MRKTLPPEIETKRQQLPGFELGRGPNGFFVIQGPTGAALKVVASDGTADPRTDGFEHVSVSCSHRMPNWKEMCFVKTLFWEDDETVYQLHPPQSEWINNHPHVLHMWRHPDRPVPMPPPLTVGIKEDGTYADEAEALAGLLRAEAKGQI